MCIFDITPDQDFEFIKENALNETKKFFTTYGRRMHIYKEYDIAKMLFWDSSYAYTEKHPIKTSLIEIRDIFDNIKNIEFSRLKLEWNSKDHIVDVIILDPNSPVFIENLDVSSINLFKYFRFVSKGRRPIMFYKHHWKDDVSNTNLPCKNPDKTIYIDIF